MLNNDILRRLRYALDIKDFMIVNIFKEAGLIVEPEHVKAIVLKEEEAGFTECTDSELDAFLSGLIIVRRGRKENSEGERPKQPFNNNMIMKKLRIALEYKEEDMLNIFKLANVKMSPAELTAIFRKEGHKNYKPCGDQFLRNFLTGLTIKLRGIGAV
jgi:uncharacterized protein YehS (DUF1456 family)